MKVKLEELIKVRTGKLDANAANENGQYPFFTCSKEPLSINTYSYDCECVLVAGNGDLNVKYYNGKFDAYQRTYILESNSNKLYMPYLYFFMDKYVDTLRKQSIGGVIKYIKLENITNVSIELPEIDNQKYICNKIYKVKELINKHKKIISYLDTFIKARFVEMFGDPISNSMGWDISTLKEITDVRDGTHDSPEYVIEGYPFITSKNISDDRIDFSEVQYISYEDYHKYEERSHVDDGDILMPMIGTIGGAVIVKKDRDFSIKNVALIKFNEKSDVNNVFIKALLNSYEMKKYFNILKTGGTQKFIGLGIIRDLPIITPSIEIQNEYKTFVQHIDKLKVA